MTNTTINDAIEIAVNEFRGIPIPTQELEDVLANYLKEALTRIAALAAAEEREACARVCEEAPLNHPGRADMTAIQLAAAIRARGQGNEKTV